MNVFESVKMGVSMTETADDHYAKKNGVTLAVTPFSAPVQDKIVACQC